MKTLLPAVLLMTVIAAAGCGGGKPPVDPKNLPPNAKPPSLLLGQGAGLMPATAEGFSLTGNLGAPVTAPMTSSQDSLHPGLLPQIPSP